MTGRLVDRYAERPDLVHCPTVPWTPTDPAPLSQAHLQAVAEYLAADRETVRQQLGGQR